MLLLLLDCSVAMYVALELSVSAGSPAERVTRTCAASAAASARSSASSGRAAIARLMRVSTDASTSPIESLAVTSGIGDAVAPRIGDGEPGVRCPGATSGKVGRNPWHATVAGEAAKRPRF